MSEFACPLGFVCQQMGDVEEDCLNYYDCQLWVSPWNFPYRRDSQGLVVDISLTYGELIYRDREIWQAEFKSYGWANPVNLPYSREEEQLIVTTDTPEGGFVKALKLPYVQIEVPEEDCKVLIVLRKEEGGWEKAEQIPLWYWMWLKAKEMSCYQEWYEWSKEFDESSAYRCPYLKKANEIHSFSLVEEFGDDIPF